MAKAFKCDLCDRLEEGDPDQALKVKPKHGGLVELEACSGCMASFNEWRRSRAPEVDEPRVSVDVPFGGASRD